MKPYATTTGATIYLGDCREVMAELEPNSIDTVISDPPYGLGFMGKGWDYGVPGVEFWQAALRVAKPGSMLVAFGGSRTFHRLTCAIEDAGWEIRDCLSWLYGSGFPKSFDISKGFDRNRDDRDEILKVTAWIRRARDFAEITNDDIDKALECNGMAGHWTTSKSQPAVPSVENWPKLLALLARHGKFPSPEILELVDRLNGRKGTAGEAWDQREKVGEKLMPDTTKLKIAAPHKAQELDRTPEPRMVDLTEPASEDAQEWNGWGTALKPGWESIVYATKPLDPEREWRYIVGSLQRLECQLCLLLSDAALAGVLSTSSLSVETLLDFAQWDAVRRSSTRADLSDRMDTSRFVSEIHTSLSIVSLWRESLAEHLADASTSTTETESRTTIDPKTWKSCLSEITPERIIEESRRTDGCGLLALRAGRILNAAVTSMNVTRELSVLAPAIESVRAKCPEDGGLELSPNWEPAILAMKPLEGTFAQNAKKWGVAGLAIDRARLEGDGSHYGNRGTVTRKSAQAGDERSSKGAGRYGAGATFTPTPPDGGRWPANVTMDGTFAQELDDRRPLDSEATSRVFYTSKASNADRHSGGANNTHPTVKPNDLMRWLCRLTATPTGGVVLDPFMGSGSTLVAARDEHRECVGIDIAEEYCRIAADRLSQGTLAF